MKKIKGQGLIEMLLIFLFIGISVVAILRFQNYLAYSTNLTQQQSDANLIAASQIETLRNYSVLNTTSGYTAYQGIANGTSSTTVGNTTYSVSWTVTTFTNPNYKVIDVTVTWTDRYGASQSINLATRIGSIDPSASARFI